MTFLQLMTRLAVRRGAASGTLNATTKTRYGYAVNESHRQVLRKPGRETLRYAPMTVASVAAQQLYAVPTEGIARINWIYDPTNYRRLKFYTRNQISEINPGSTQGTPYAWSPTGYVEAFVQPSNASSVFVKSTSAADTTQTAYVEGYITGGYYRTASVALTGTTAVNLSAAISTFIHVTKFYLSAVAAGTVSLTEDSGAGTELSRITIGKTRAQYYAFMLEPVPAAAITYSLDVLRNIPDMVNDTDEPLLPEDFHDLLIDMAELKELRKADDPNRYAMLTADVKRGDAELQTFLTSHPDWRPSFNGPAAEFSSLGAFYPADTVIR